MVCGVNNEVLDAIAYVFSSQDSIAFDLVLLFISVLFLSSSHN
jgi:hypothetical protein